MQTVAQTASGFRSFAIVLGLTVSVLGLSGCVSSKNTTDEALTIDPNATEEPATVEGKDAIVAAYRDQQVAAVGATASGTDERATAVASASSGPVEEPAPMTMQSTGVNAMSNSIFSSQQSIPPAIAGDAAPATSAPGPTPRSNSLFNNAQPASEPPALPVEGARNAQSSEALLSAAAKGAALPASGATVTASVNSFTATTAPSGMVGSDGETGSPAALAALFAAKRKNKTEFSGDRSKTKGRLASSSEDIAPKQVAALGFSDLPGVQTR